MRCTDGCLAYPNVRNRPPHRRADVQGTAGSDSGGVWLLLGQDELVDGRKRSSLSLTRFAIWDLGFAMRLERLPRGCDDEGVTYVPCEAGHKV